MTYSLGGLRSVLFTASTADVEFSVDRQNYISCVGWVILRREQCAELYVSTFQGFYFILILLNFCQTLYFRIEGEKITHNTVDVEEICGPSHFLLASNSTVSLMS